MRGPVPPGFGFSFMAALCIGSEAETIAGWSHGERNVLNGTARADASTPARSPSSRRWRRSGGIRTASSSRCTCSTPAGSTTSSTRSPPSSAAIRRRRGRSPGCACSTSAAAAGCCPSRWRGSGPRSSGADAAARNIPVARLHAEQSGLAIDYRHTTAEDLAAAGERFDVVLNMEVVEHVPDPLVVSDRLPGAAQARRADDLLDAEPQSRRASRWRSSAPNR